MSDISDRYNKLADGFARAKGGDETLDLGDVRRMFDIAQGFGETMRSPEAFGPALEPPEGADEQTRLLAFLGREA